MSSGSTIVSHPDAAVTNVAAQVLAENANRKEIIVGSLEANAVNIRIGDSSVTAAIGQQLVPGAAVALCMKGELWAITESGAGDLCLTEILE